MIPVQRLEIVVDSLHSGRITELLSRHGLRGWTLLRDVTGAGERGRQFDDELSGISSNHLILTTCPPERLDSLLEDLRALLVESGGICLVSDARWLRH